MDSESRLISSGDANSTRTAPPVCRVRNFQSSRCQLYTLTFCSSGSTLSDVNELRESALSKLLAGI